MSAPEWMQKFKEIGMKGEPEIVSYDRRSSAVIKIDNSDELSQPTSSIEEKLKQRKQEQVGSSQPTDFRGALKHREEDQKEGKDDAKAASDDAPAFGAELKKALHEEIESPVEQERNWPVSTVTETADYIPISPAASVETEEIVVIEDEEIVEDEYIEEVITEEGTSEYEEMSLKHEDNVVLESEPFDARKEENVETEGGQFSFRHENNSVDKNEPIGDGDLQREQKPVAVQKKGHKDSFEDKKKTRTQKDPPTALYHSDESELDEESQQQRKNTSQTGKNRSEMIAKEDKTFHIIVCFLLFLMISGGVAVALVFVLNNEEMAPGEGETTYLDPLQTGNCDFTGLVQPHIIDQCSCNGKISIISDDIRARYEIHLADFIPTVYQSYEESISSCSVRNQALVWLSSGNDYQFAYEERRQRFGLSALFIGLSGEKWNDREHWLSTRGSCVWFGVGCNNDDAVKRLSLEKNNVSGGIHHEITFLQNLEVVSFAENKITGEVPSGLFSLRDLKEVYLSSNQIEGAIPDTIEGATVLMKFHVDMNLITGLIPNFGQVRRLRTLKMGNNRFKGEIPSQIFNLLDLTDLDINNNTITGTIPSGIASALSLKTLNLSHNTLEDNIPSEVGSLIGLDVLDLSENLLTGSIPEEFGKLSALTQLRLNENLLTGSLPSELGHLNPLESLVVNGNRIGGSAPDEICQLRDTSLEEFVVDCPTGLGLRDGVECDVPDCCTECKGG